MTGVDGDLNGLYLTSTKNKQQDAKTLPENV